MKTERECFLVYENGMFVGSTPSADGNDIFEIEQVAGAITLRLVNFPFDEEELTSGSGDEEEPTTSTTEVPSDATEVPSDATETTETTSATLEDTTTEPTEEPSTSDEETTTPTVCYIGFADANSPPQCYESKDMAATRFILV